MDSDDLDSGDDPRAVAARVEAQELIYELGLDPATILLVIQAIMTAIQLWKECREKHAARFISASRMQRSDLAAKLVRRGVRSKRSRAELEERLRQTMSVYFESVGGRRLVALLTERCYAANNSHLCCLAGDPR